MIQSTLLAIALSSGTVQDASTATLRPESPPPPVQVQVPNITPASSLAHIRAQEWEWIMPPLPLYPVEAINAGTRSGMTRLTCHFVDDLGVVSNCEAVLEMPTGQGFAAAQLEAMPTGRLSPAGIERFRQEGFLTFTTQFLPPDTDVRDSQGRVPAELPPTMRRGTSSFAFDGRTRAGVVTWEAPPRPQIPDRAHSRGVYDGFAIVACTSVSDDRVLSRCFIVEESPAGFGFGQSVLNAMPAARVGHEAADAVRQGRPVAFRIKFGAS